MTLNDILYFAGLPLSLVLLIYVLWLRYWLLATGFLLRIWVDGYLGYLKILRLRDPAPVNAPEWLANLNRILSGISVVMITVAIAMILHRYAQMRARAEAAQPPPLRLGQ